MSRNAISANPEHYILKIFRGSTSRRPKKIFSRLRVAQKFFQDPKQKILDRALPTIHLRTDDLT